MHHDVPASPTPVSNGSALLRLVWMAGLPLMLLCVVLIANQAKWTFGRYDIALLVLVVAAIAARGLDALRYGGTTARGEPADRSHVTGYAARLLGLAAGSWLLAQAVTL